MRVQPVQGALVDLAGHRDLPLGLEAADRLDRRRVVGAGHVAEQPLDRHQPGLQVAHLLAGVAAREERRSGVQDVEQLVVGRLVVIEASRCHVRRSTMPVASRPRLAWKPRTASRVAGS